jgi:anti-sigma regulatory factor (Ser/Thr protein kinase)
LEETIAQDTIALTAQDTLVLYSDGLTDAVDAAGVHFGLARMTRTLQSLLRTHRRPGTITHGMQRMLQRFTQDKPITDDMTLLVLQLPDAAGLRSRRFEMARALPQLSALRAFVNTSAQASALSEADATALVLAAVEVASNAIRHDTKHGDAPLEVISQSTPEGCRIEMLYAGDAFLPPKDLDIDFSGASDGGFGLYIIRASCDTVRYTHEDGINRVILLKRRPI